jgi:hypothetical protein
MNRNCDTAGMARPQEKQTITQIKQFYSKLRLSYYLPNGFFPADVAG